MQSELTELTYHEFKQFENKVLELEHVILCQATLSADVEVLQDYLSQCSKTNLAMKRIENKLQGLREYA